MKRKRLALVLRASLCAFILVFDYQLVAIAGVCFFDISVVVYTLFYFISIGRCCCQHRPMVFCRWFDSCLEASAASHVEAASTLATAHVASGVSTACTALTCTLALLCALALLCFHVGAVGFAFLTLLTDFTTLAGCSEQTEAVDEGCHHVGCNGLVPCVGS